eukprot:TRINITY_DN19268_c0_g1_i1.p1 TRINITY_DN19268_c0_g1~~TRINITY_DN19268_c0_g1_i1.p1  ORF type:complete len:353 (+),score=78.06 TRINITY_DN19268_c0_g1_i1:60-1118(+)
MRPTRMLSRLPFAVRQKMKELPQAEDGAAAYGAFGFRSARGMDEMPGLAQQSPEATLANLTASLTYNGKRMDEKRGWGSGTGIVDMDGIKEDYEGTDYWRVNVGQDLAEKAGEEGLEKWIEDRKEEIDLKAPYKPIPSTHEREDLPPYLHWMVPPKRVRLELKMKEDARRLKKTPEFDLSAAQKRVLQMMYDGLENATAAFPIPIHGSRENFCITHIECVQWKSKEQWVVCWKLVLDPSQRPQYDALLSSTASKLVFKWGRMIRDYYAPCRSLVPVLQFLYDDGSIPYRPSYIEKNLYRTSRGEAPIPLYGRNKELWGMQPIRDNSIGVRANKETQEDPVRNFLLEARRELG